MKRFYYILLLAGLFFSCEKPISEFQSQNFIKFFGSGYESKGNDVIELSTGGYLMTGYDKINGTDQQVIVVKVDENGNLIWSNTYGQTKNIDEGKVVKEVSDGYLIAGTFKDDVINITHSFILKIDFNGNQIYLNQFGSSDYNITVNDIIATDQNIYVAGSSDISMVGATDYFVSRLDNLGVKVWDKSFSVAKNSSYKRIFIKDGNLLVIGDDGIENRISITPIDVNTSSPGDAVYTGDSNDKIFDASLAGDELYILSTGSVNTKLFKLNSSNSVVWDYESSIIKAKSVAYNEDGSLIVCGESEVEGNSQIHFIKINTDGTIYKNEDYFRFFKGTVGRLINTKDNGLLLIGSTNDTYGMNIQLIKTDKDYFMLKK